MPNNILKVNYEDIGGGILTPEELNSIVVQYKYFGAGVTPSYTINKKAVKALVFYSLNGTNGSAFINFNPMTGDIIPTGSNYSYRCNSNGLWVKNTDFYLIISSTSVSLNTTLSGSGTINTGLVCTTES